MAKFYNLNAETREVVRRLTEHPVTSQSLLMSAANPLELIKIIYWCVFLKKAICLRFNLFLINPHNKQRILSKTKETKETKGENNIWTKL